MEQLRWSGDGSGPLLDRALALADSRPRRVVLGIVGAPGCGKSTLTEQLLADLERARPGLAVGVGMDAFHLGHRVLERRGLVGVKGAPQTFDVGGYVQLLRRLRDEPGTVYAPEFDRSIEDSLAAVVEVGPEVRLVVTEGNYLLLDEPGWREVRGLLDEAWYVDLPAAERQRRLALRHERYGRTRAESLERTLGSDEANALRVAAGRDRADVVVEQTDAAGAAPIPG